MKKLLLQLTLFKQKIGHKLGIYCFDGIFNWFVKKLS